MNTITVNDRTRPYRSLDVHESPSSGYESFSGTPEAHEHQAEAHTRHTPSSLWCIDTIARATPSRKPLELRLIPNSKAPGVSDDCRTNTRAPRIHNAARSVSLRTAGRTSAARRSLGRSATSRAAARYDTDAVTRHRGAWSVLLAQCAAAYENECAGELAWQASKARRRAASSTASFGLETGRFLHEKPTRTRARWFLWDYRTW